MKTKVNLLFVCTYNKMRSKTGEFLYGNDPRFAVKSAGIDEDAEVILDGELIEWADCTVVMENLHLNWIHRHYPNQEKKTRILCLNIPDRYFFMQESLVKLIREKFETLYYEN